MKTKLFSLMSVAVLGGFTSLAPAVTFSGSVFFNNSTDPPLFANADVGRNVNLTLSPLTLGLAPASAPSMRVGNGLLSSSMGFTELRSQVTMEAWVGGGLGPPPNTLSFYGHDLTPGAPISPINGEPPFFFLTIRFKPGTFPTSATPELYKERIDSDPTVWNNVTEVRFDFREGIVGPFAVVEFAVPEPSSALFAVTGLAVLFRRHRAEPIIRSPLPIFSKTSS